MKIKEIRGLSNQDLNQKLKEIKSEIFNLRFQKATGKAGGNVRRIRNLRKDIARILTVLREREMNKT